MRPRFGALRKDGAGRGVEQTEEIGEWLSLVEHLVRDQGVAGSNPVSPTPIRARVYRGNPVGSGLSLARKGADPAFQGCGWGFAGLTAVRVPRWRKWIDRFHNDVARLFLDVATSTPERFAADLKAMRDPFPFRVIHADQSSPTSGGTESPCSFIHLRKSSLPSAFSNASAGSTTPSTTSFLSDSSIVIMPSRFPIWMRLAS